MARLLLTALTVVLGVSFVVSAFVLADGLRSSFGDLSADIIGETDLLVTTVDNTPGEIAISEDLRSKIAEIDGVRATAGFREVQGVRPLDVDGQPISSQGPQFGFNWIDDPALSSFSLVDGVTPGAGEFVMDRTTASENDFEMGQTYDLITAHGEIESFELVGLASFGQDNIGLGAQFFLFDTPELERMNDLEPGVYDQIAVAFDDDATYAEVSAEVRPLIDSGLDILSQRTAQADQAAEFNSAISVIESVLLGFAVISLFVSAFIISNTFGMLLAQRTREFGLLRSIGAEPGQIRSGVLIEAFVLGVFSSGAGILGGLGLERGIRALVDAVGLGLPGGDLVIMPRTIIAAFVVGVGVTMVAAVLPAIKAARLSPIAALSGTEQDQEHSLTKRLVAGSALFAIGVGVGGWGLFAASGSSILAGMGLGALAVFLGVAFLGPVLAPWVVGIVGWPLGKIFGIPGELATQNARRNPRRTASTAAALMIGLALVTTALVTGESLKAGLDDSLGSTVRVDYAMFSENEVPARLADELRALPEAGDVIQVSYTDGTWTTAAGDEVGGSVTGTSLTELATTFDIGVIEGELPTAGTNEIALGIDHATELAIGVGDTTNVMFPSSGESADFIVTAIYDDPFVFEGEHLIDFDLLSELSGGLAVDWMGARVADGVTAEAAAPAFAAWADDHPQLSVQTEEDYLAEAEGQVDQLLAIINALVGLAVLIALIGIGLTLALSVFERTREIGLLRAVGMTRSQVRRMVRWEAALVALFGAVMGVGVGLLFGWASVSALPAELLPKLSIPVVRILIMVGIAGTAGLIAALLPARTASRLNVLDAIATD